MQLTFLSGSILAGVTEQELIGMVHQCEQYEEFAQNGFTENVMSGICNIITQCAQKAYGQTPMQQDLEYLSNEDQMLCMEACQSDTNCFCFLIRPEEDMEYDEDGEPKKWLSEQCHECFRNTVFRSCVENMQRTGGDLSFDDFWRELLTRLPCMKNAVMSAQNNHIDLSDYMRQLRQIYHEVFAKEERSTWYQFRSLYEMMNAMKYVYEGIVRKYNKEYYIETDRCSPQLMEYGKKMPVGFMPEGTPYCRIRNGNMLKKL